MHRLIILFFMLSPGAVYSCDPQTQYESNDGQCCKKCGPGTRMPQSPYVLSCLDPQCVPCLNDEYQDTYTEKDKCELQPYCDPNKNFARPHEHKTKRSSCVCVVGYHCSSKACLTCLPHTICEAGEMRRYRGNHTHDTVCEKCPPNTFSTGTSEDGGCKAWTACEPGYQMKTNGTATSDVICEKSQRVHTSVWIVIGIAVPAVVAILVFWCSRGNAKGNVKSCVESCLEVNKKPGVELVNAFPFTDEHSLTSEAQSPQQEQTSKTPEENEVEDEQTLISDDTGLTDNGNVVVQEDGKKEALSRQESTTQSLLSSFE
ncbi:tumor necrosis factor receptor superfamily member 5 [Polymixia lowei]